MTVVSFEDKEIQYRISKLKELPPLPTSLKRLIEIIHSEVDVSGELASIISYDPSLSAKILGTANSALYGQRKQVKTISRAIDVLGTAQAKSISTYTLLVGVFLNGSVISEAHREMLWKHAFACFRIAVEVNRRRPWIKTEEAALFGLLHDIGWIVMAAYLNEQFTAIFEQAQKDNISPWCVEMRYGLDHGKLGKYLACRWALPEELKAVMEFHHAPERSTSFSTEVSMMYLVNVLSHSHEYPELLDEKSTMLQRRKLLISDEEWGQYQEVTEGIWPEVEQLWNALGKGPK